MKRGPNGQRRAAPLWFVAGAATVGVIAAMSAGGVASAATVHVQSPHNASGTVVSVDDSGAPGTCGRAGAFGSFVVVGHNTTQTVDVFPGTVFKERNVSSPSFADVCVGDTARAKGTASANNVVTASQVTIVQPPPKHVAGTVESVNGVATTGACGTPGSMGSFVVFTQNTTKTVDVVAGTVFREHGVAAPSFGDVCVGDTTKSLGVLSGTVLSARQVTVVPPRPEHVPGTVLTVDGSGSSETCGQGGAAGAFTVSSRGASVTVDVSTATRFKERGASAPSFAGVCVGTKVRVMGPASTPGTVAATQVVIVPPRPQHVAGAVVSVEGNGSAGTCGLAATAGSFTVRWHDSSVTVDVSPTTTFRERDVSKPSFADVCVGDKVRSVGALADGLLTARQVSIAPPRPRHVSGTVASVDGASTAGTCGSAGTAGSFTLSSHGMANTVDVAPDTIFAEHGVSQPTFHVVCVGDSVRVTGTQPAGEHVVTATDVLVTTSPETR